MPDPMTGIVAGTTLVNGYTSKKAADQSAAGAEKGLAQTAAMADQSRRTALNLYNQARISGRLGLMGAFDYNKNAAKSKYQPFMQANTMAQNVIGQGAQQANNAILGNPVDMSFSKPQQINPDLSFIDNAKIVQPVGDYEIAQQAQQYQSGGGGGGGGGLPLAAGIAGKSIIGRLLK